MTEPVIKEENLQSPNQILEVNFVENDILDSELPILMVTDNIESAHKLLNRFEGESDENKKRIMVGVVQ